MAGMSKAPTNTDIISLMTLHHEEVSKRLDGVDKRLDGVEEQVKYTNGQVRELKQWQASVKAVEADRKQRDSSQWDMKTILALIAVSAAAAAATIAQLMGRVKI